MPQLTEEKRFEIFYKFIDWHCWSLGVHIDPLAPRIELHIPTGWIRIGWNGNTSRKMTGWEDGAYYLIGRP